MKTYSGFEYLCIDVANSAGKDKLLFEERIQWTLDHLSELETLAVHAETKPLYHKAVMAIRKVQQGKPTGHMVGLDASCSGLQLMSAMTGCWTGAEATNLVNPDARNDAYSMCTENMNNALAAQFLSVQVPRGRAKQALMTVMYGSKAKPVEIFGEDTPELKAFYDAAVQLAPGAWELLQDLKAAWQPYALVHEWDLPDGFHARVKVMERVEARVEVDELNHASFSYIYYVNQGQKKGISLVANSIHSCDAFVLREMHRRCNYDPLVLFFAHEAIQQELDLREQHITSNIPVDIWCSLKLQDYIELFEATKQPTAAILPFIQDGRDTQYLSTNHLKKLLRIVEQMNTHKAFPLVSVHDEFRAHANNCNHVRMHYASILAELSESQTLNSIFTQIYGIEVKYQKLSENLGDAIRNSSYALS